MRVPYEYLLSVGSVEMGKHAYIETVRYCYLVRYDSC